MFIKKINFYKFNLLVLVKDKQIPIIKNVLTPIQFFNKLPVDIIGQNRINKVLNEINL